MVQMTMETEAVRNCLDRILSSPMFNASLRQQRFLRHIVEKTLTNEEHLLRGYGIGLDVFDRPADFDPTTDSIVRVEAGRLRFKLREYYDLEGTNDAIVISLPKGTYVPTLSKRQPTSPGETLVSQPVLEKPSITVMPFVNMTGDPEQEYFSDGIAEDLIHDLSRIPGLLVIIMLRR